MSREEPADWARIACLIDALEAKGELADYHLLPAARADLLRREGRWKEAVEAYRQALGLVANDPERRYLSRRLAEVEGLQSAGGNSIVH